jgi:hypothetical protein
MLGGSHLARLPGGCREPYIPTAIHSNRTNRNRPAQRALRRARVSTVNMAKTKVVNSKFHISLLAIVFMSGYGNRESMEMLEVVAKSS